MFPSLNDGIEYADSVSASVEIIEEASGVEAYKSCSRVRPRDITGVVAYTGMRVNKGKCLQQWAKAPRCAVVAWVSRMKESVGTCLP